MRWSTKEILKCILTKYIYQILRAHSEDVYIFNKNTLMRYLFTSSMVAQSARELSSGNGQENWTGEMGRGC